MKWKLFKKWCWQMLTFKNLAGNFRLIKTLECSYFLWFLNWDQYWNYTGNLHRVDLSVVKHVLYFFRSSNMSFLFSNRSSKTFKPKKNIPEGSHQHELMKHANATLGSGISIDFFLDNRSWTDLMVETDCRTHG